MVLRRIERREIEPVRFDFGPVCHLEAHGAKDAFDALKRERNGVQPALPSLAARQAHVKRFGLQLQLQLDFGQGLAARRQGGLYGLLGKVDGCAARLFLVGRELRHALHKLGHSPGFAQKLGFRIFEIGGRCAFRKGLPGGLNQGIQVVHKYSSKKQGLVPFQALALAVIALIAIYKIAICGSLRQPAWPLPAPRCCQMPLCRAQPDRPASCGRSRWMPFSGRWQTGCRSGPVRAHRR